MYKSESKKRLIIKNLTKVNQSKQFKELDIIELNKVTGGFGGWINQNIPTTVVNTNNTHGIWFEFTMDMNGM